MYGSPYGFIVQRLSGVPHTSSTCSKRPGASFLVDCMVSQAVGTRDAAFEDGQISSGSQQGSCDNFRTSSPPLLAAGE